LFSNWYNWFVPYHQDLSINVSEKVDSKIYINWTNKRNQIGVQPPIEVLENIFTVIIHLDDTDRNNGALKIIPISHLKGIIRTASGNTNSTSKYAINYLSFPVLLHLKFKS